MSLRVTTTDRAIHLEIDRPERRNALDLELSGALRTVLSDTRESRLPLVISSSTPGMFVAGADIAELAQRTRVEALAQVNHELFLALEDHPSPTIALVDGPALGGGTELALACDFRISTTRALWGLPEVRLGIIPSAGGIWRLPRIVGRGTAVDLLLTGRRIDGAEAYRIGLASRLCEPEDLDAELTKLLDQLSASSPTAMSYIKRLMHTSPDRSRTAEAALQALSFESDDARTRFAAFLERRSENS